MTKLLTNNFRTWQARQFIKSFVGRDRSILAESLSRYVDYEYIDPNYSDLFVATLDPDNIEAADVGYFYVFAGNGTWASNTVPTPNTDIQSYHYEMYDNMEFGKKVSKDDIRHMVARHDWTSGTVYANYDHTDQTLHEKAFFTVVEESNSFHVFKCIDNNNDSVSTHKPSPFEYNAPDGSILTNATQIGGANYYYKTSDGYVWMYLYSFSNQEFQKFATNSFIPLPQKISALPAAIGAIKAIEVVTPGLYHTTYQTGYIKQSFVDGSENIFHLTTDGNDFFSYTNFYEGCSIYIVSGTGRGQIRKITSSQIVNNERRIYVDQPFYVGLDGTSQFEISPTVEIVGDGTGAVARAVVNSIKQVDQIEMISFGSGYSYANVSVISNTGYISADNQFVATTTTATARAIISPSRGHGRDLINELYADKITVSVDFEGNTHPTTSFNQYGLIVDPLFSGVEVEFGAAAPFTIGELMYQETNASYGVVDSVANNVVTLANVRGVFEANTMTVGLTSNTQLTSLAINKDMNNYSMTDVVDNSGEILLIKNDLDVTRADGQTERVRLTVDF